MGTGKSTVGRILAERTARPYVDSDARVEAASGLDAAGVAAAHGIVALHRLELQVLEAALQSPDPSVIGSAASVVDTAAGRALLATADEVVWLQVPLDVLIERVAEGGDHRPFGDNRVAVLREQAASRRPLYEQVATVTVDADRKPEAVAAEILAAVARAPTRPERHDG